MKIPDFLNPSKYQDGAYLSGGNIESGYGYVPGLDGLRAVSITIVVLGHFFFADRGGLAALGVYMFFIISGFLITRLMFAELKVNGNLNLWNFFKRRLLRLYPVLFAFMAMACLMQVLIHQPVPLIEVEGVFFYFINYLSSWYSLNDLKMYLPIRSFWSLSVEEHFYFIAPVFFFLVKGRLKPMLWFAAALCIGPLLIRFLYVTVSPEVIGHLVTYKNSDTRFDSIAVGVLLAVLCETSRGRDALKLLSGWLVFIAGLVLIAITTRITDSIFGETLRFSAYTLGFVPLVCAVVFGQNFALFQKLMNLPIIVWIGRLSYSIYIWHQGVSKLIALSPVAKLPHLVFGMVEVAAVIVVAAASYYWVEQPALRLKKYITKPRENLTTV